MVLLKKYNSTFLSLSHLIRRNKSSLLKTPSFHNTEEKEDLKYLILPSEMEKEYKQSFFGRCSKLRHTKDFNDTTKSLFIFRDYIVPDSKKDPVFALLIKKSYLYLFTAKSMNILMPYFMKNGINQVTLFSNPQLASMYFVLYGLSNLGSSYFDARKTVENSKVVQTALYKISLRVFKKLMELDL